MEQLTNELLNLAELNHLTEREKQLAKRVIQIITTKEKKDQISVIDLNIFHSEPNPEDKDGIIAKLKEEAKLNRKIISEYMRLKEEYYGQIVKLKNQLLTSSGNLEK
jgi:regulator of protease activity HflC (stomatin/prohibitin superfamily)